MKPSVEVTAPDLEGLPFEVEQKGWMVQFLASLVVLCTALVLAPYLHKPLDRITKETNKRINGTVNPPFVRSLERVAFSPTLTLSHPYSHLQDDVREMLLGTNRGQTNQMSAWRALKNGPSKNISDLRVLKVLATNEDGAPLSLLRLYGYASEERRLLSDAVAFRPDGMSEFALADWVAKGYNDIATEHFKRSEYFLGISAVEDGIGRSRLRPIENLRGTDGLTAVISPLVVINSFFPSNENSSQPERDLNREASLVLSDDYDTLARGAPASSEPLYAYASGVSLLRSQKYEKAAQAFTALHSRQSDSTARELTTFMAIRSDFWDYQARLETTPAPAPRRQERPAEVAPVPKPQGPLEQAAAFMVKALAAEFAKNGVVLVQRKVQAPAASSIPQSNDAAEVDAKHHQSTGDRRVCAQGLAQIDTLLSSIKTPYWKQQAAPYATALKEKCDGL